jgi:hypothetical protein
MTTFSSRVCCNTKLKLRKKTKTPIALRRIGYEKDFVCFSQDEKDFVCFSQDEKHNYHIFLKQKVGIATQSFFLVFE